VSEHVKSELCNIVRDILLNLGAYPLDNTSFLSWRKSENGNWQGAEEFRPSLSIGLMNNVPDELFTRCKNVMEECFPDYGVLIGTESGMQVRVDEQRVLGSLMGEIYNIKGNLILDEMVVESVVEDLLQYFKKAHINVEFIVPIVNLMLEEGVQEIPITDTLKIKRLTNAEFTDIHGGPLRSLIGSLKPHGARYPDIAFIGYFKDPIIKGMVLNEGQTLKSIFSLLDRAVLALRSYKNGSVGYLEIRLKALEYNLSFLGQNVKMQEAIPLDAYYLGLSDLSSFQNHIRLLVGKTNHSSLEVALSRLFDAENRPSSRDKLIDAVIGLEAILLSTNAKQPYRQELRYRFSLNYSTFFNTPESKLENFRKARSIYDLRSTIAHGGSFENNKTYSVGSQKLNPAEIANEACSMLRMLIKWSLHSGESPMYLKEGFWENRIFGVTED